MKKYIPVIIGFSLLSSVGLAQFNKGTTLLGGDLSFGFNKAKDGALEYKTSGFTFSPVFAKAVKENKFWGVTASFSYNESTPSFPNTSSKFTGAGAGIFYRQYKPLLRNLYAYINTGIFSAFGKNKYRNGTDYFVDDKNFTASLIITPGISIAASKKLFLECGINNIASINYSHSKSTGTASGNPVNRSSNGFNFSSSLGNFSNSLFLGFRFMLPKNS